MTYTIAAYSITIGVLALYGLLIRHRERMAVAEVLAARPADASGTSPSSEASTNGLAPNGFNVGAALMAPLWMLAHGMGLPGAILVVACLALWPLSQAELWLPFAFVAMVPVAAGAALGFVGNRIAAEKLELRDPAALSKTQLPWALAGIVLHVFLLPWVVYSFFL